MRTPVEAIMLAVSIVAVSVTMSLVVIRCSESKTEERRTETPEKPIPDPETPPIPPEPKDVPVLKYLSTQREDVGGRWKIRHKKVILEELYTLEDMPYESGLVKFDTSGKSCIVFPVAYWEKLTEEARCVVTIHFDCHGNERHHTSECIVL